jgi:XTP/dITP diphosphohydrolase
MGGFDSNTILGGHRLSASEQGGSRFSPRASGIIVMPTTIDSDFPGAPMPRLVLGTRNRKKREELADLLKDMPFEVLDLSGFGDIAEVEETGSTFEENATLKAVGYARAVREWVLAEDSGLVVPALNGRPGVHSAHYAGVHGDDAGNNKRLLAELAPLPDDRRAAFYICVAILAGPQGEVVQMTDGKCHGVIIKEPRGAGGFGYDPLFLVPEYHRTFGELSLRVKQALSHRSKAVAKMRPALRQI